MAISGFEITFGDGAFALSVEINGTTVAVAVNVGFGCEISRVFEHAAVADVNITDSIHCTAISLHVPNIGVATLQGETVDYGFLLEFAAAIHHMGVVVFSASHPLLASAFFHFPSVARSGACLVGAHPNVSNFVVGIENGFIFVQFCAIHVFQSTVVFACFITSKATIERHTIFQDKRLRCLFS